MYRFLYFAPSHLTCSSKCLTNLKGLPLVLCPTVFEHTGYQRLRETFSQLNFILIGPVFSCEDSGGEEDTRGTRQTPHKEVAFSQLHSQLKEMKSSLSSAGFKNVVFWKWKLVHALISIVLIDLTQACFFFSLRTWYETNKKRIRLKCLLVSMISQTMPTQTSALCSFSDCHALFVSLGNVSSTQTHTNSHSLVRSGGKVVEKGVDWGISP